ncbi:MAG: thiamine diphosphokinase [Bacteroidales bacterium]|nr:thiamine diphosphokinase [Bacteroidales bacterium]
MKKNPNHQLSTANCQPSTVVVANGKFPDHEIPLNVIANADVVVCCDGATANVDKHGIIPTAIVGDLDSLTSFLKSKYADKLHHDPDQNTNDLTKAIKWCLSRNHTTMDIIGATGLREDHTLGNIGLLPLYARMGARVRMFTDNGFIIPLLESQPIDSFAGQQVSIFSPNNLTKITSTNLKYPIDNGVLNEYWMGTLNESLGEKFTLEFEPGPLILFLKYLQR